MAGIVESGSFRASPRAVRRGAVVQKWLSDRSGPGTFASQRTVFSMLASWLGIFAVSVIAEVITTCYYRALAADGPGRRGRAMFWSGAARIVGLLLLKHVVSAHGAAGFVAASGFVAGDVVGTWLALWYEDRRAAAAVVGLVQPTVEPTMSAAEVSALVDARVAAALRARDGDDGERWPAAAVAHWRAPAYTARRDAPRRLHLAE